MTRSMSRLAAQLNFMLHRRLRGNRAVLESDDRVALNFRFDLEER